MSSCQSIHSLPPSHHPPSLSLSPGISKPLLDSVKIDKACNIYLNGAVDQGSAILNLINDDGKYVNASHLWMYHCED
jgi:hypothetical protein